MSTKIKGASIKARIEYLKDDLGGEVTQKVKEILGQEDKVLLFEKTILVSTMYDISVNARLDAAIAQVLNPTNPIKVYRELGRASADKNLQGFHRTYLKGDGPHDVLKSYSNVRKSYYSDGEAEYLPTGKTSGLLTLKNVSNDTKEDCESTVGYFERAIELMKGKNVSAVVKKAIYKGDSECEIHFQWSA